MKKLSIMHVGEKIRMIRLLKGIKQEDMARYLGMRQQSYSSLEGGTTKMNEEKLRRIASKFEMTPEEIENFAPTNIFNNWAYEHSQQVINGDAHYHFPEDVKKLYEDKIALLEENRAHLKFENDLLRAEIAKLKKK